MLKKAQLIIASLFFLIFISEKSYAQLFWDQACSFNGTASSYFSVKHSSTLNLPGSFTIEMWINPVNVSSPSIQHLMQKRVSGSNGYAVLLNGGKVEIRTNNVSRIIGNASLPNNVWSHIAARYNSSNGVFSVYINSVLDASVTIAGAAAVSNTDTLIIGKGGSNPFSGLIDNLRIWNNVLTPTELGKYYRSIIATNSGKYSDLVLSLPFQHDHSDGSHFTLDDRTSYDNDGLNRGIAAYSLMNRPSVTTASNESVFINSADDYLSGKANATVSPVTEITIEAWVRADQDIDNLMVVSKGQSMSAGVRYGLYIEDDFSGYLRATINGNETFVSDNYSWSGTWNHVAFTYSSLDGKYEFFLNGKSIGVGVNNQGTINSAGTDSIFVGDHNDLGEFFIDEVRISNKVKSLSYIKKGLYKNIEDGVDSSTVTEAVYNFDGYLTCATDNGPELHFRNGAMFSHPAAIPDIPVSPLISTNVIPESFYMNEYFERIPSFGTDGYIDNSFYVWPVDSIYDINVFVALNHTRSNNLKIVLYSPEGDSCVLFNQNEFAGEADNVICIFDDQADSSIANSLSYASITPKIKPLNNLNSAFNLSKTNGSWTLRIYDLYLSDFGYLYSWGFQVNNQNEKRKVQRAVMFSQGFYSPALNNTIRDTFTCKLRSITSPYAVIGTSNYYLETNGTANFDFTNTPVSFEQNYFIQINHRNSIETWSSGYTNFRYFSGYAFGYTFTLDSLYTFGENVISVDNSPKRFAMYSGDVNQDGVVDATDNGAIDNDATNFATGYLPTDLNGDEVIDASDAAISDNNAANFVSKITP